ncbi:hypothetical protein NDU88_000213 [Pleurodeles waltl]|uniref:Uncharacterized protein n=1 Tax=Pleurodeles waltl TaxID=8319 RepID=A0AAV7P1V6_PLEWA|nr:hypothetical protein NDU88_000213 [Pleurodeles waltl]
MAAIQDLWASIAPLEPKLDTVQIDVNLLRADMGKISAKVAAAETHIDVLQATIKRLEEQVRSLTKKSEIMEARLQDQEERSRRNNAVLGVAKKETRLACATIEKDIVSLEATALASNDPDDCEKLRLRQSELRALAENQAK